MTDPFKLIESSIRDIPIPIFAMLEDLGIGPEIKELPDNISGWIERTDDMNYLVVINSRHALTRRRFTAAHELGHYIYHRDILGRGSGDTRAYRSAGTPFSNSLITPQHERQANSFAANILMPHEQIARLREQGITEPSDLAARFLVSEEAMRIRLGLPRDQGFRF
jgi:Zn-dependent peptidase ImmA (M78 family)